MIKHKKKFGVYHWDTFDNETDLIGEFDTRKEASEFVQKRYGTRISPNGADRVEVVNNKGNIVETHSIC